MPGLLLALMLSLMLGLRVKIGAIALIITGSSISTGIFKIGWVCLTGCWVDGFIAKPIIDLSDTFKAG